jgi:hypothetical protein
MLLPVEWLKCRIEGSLGAAKELGPHILELSEGALAKRELRWPFVCDHSKQSSLHRVVGVLRCERTRGICAELSPQFFEFLW